MVRWARGTFQGLNLKNDREGCRRAFRIRFKTAPGIIFNDTYEYGGPLYFENLEVPAPGPKLMNMIRDVEDKMIAPNGDEFSHAILGWRYLDELRSGFYHDQVWPTNAEDEVLERSQLAHEQQQDYTLSLIHISEPTRPY